MKIIKTYQEALQICKKYIDLKQNIQATVNIETPFDPPSVFIRSGPWEISLNSLENTLNYIYNYLHHSCYLLCSDGNSSILFKLENVTTPPFFKNVINNELATLNNNTILSEKQRSNIRNSLRDTNKLRILQCIVKKIRENSTISNEYETFIQNIQLPIGVYVMNLTDANLLNKNGLEPFPVFRGKNPPIPTDFVQKTFLPIFSLSGNIQFYDIPIPNYDDIIYSLNQAKYNIDDFITKWSDKTISKAVFRGGPSGCGYTIETNQRLLLTTFSSSLDLDVGIVVDPNKTTIDSNSIRFDPIHGLGMLNTGISPVNRLSYLEQSHYKYIIHIDGNVNAYRLLSIMATGSLILRVKSNYTSWFDHLISANQHFIDINSDLSNLLEKIEWCKQHDVECSQIASKSLAFSREVLLNPNYIRGAFQKIVNASITNQKISFYFKSDNPCNTGFIEDKKNKDKCNKIVTKKKQLIKIKPVVEPPVVEPPVDLTSYIKGENEKKCKKGYVQDKKDKTKCNSIQKSESTKKVKPNVESLPINKTRKILLPLENTKKVKLIPLQEYTTHPERRKCDTIKLKIKNMLNPKI